MTRIKRTTAWVAAAIVVGSMATPAAASGPGIPFAWGDNSLGQLGDGTTADHITAAPVTGLDDVVEIAGGRGHVLARRSDGSVWAWGSNDMGQVGDGTVVDRTLPLRVAGLPSITAISAGHYHSLALTSTGTVMAWGFNSLGQLGDGTVTNRRTPVTVAGLSSVTAITGGRDMSFALRSDGTVWGWGQNTLGQLGDGTTTNRRTAVRVGTLTNVIGIAGGRDHGLAVRSDGTVWAWGHNAYGQVGDGTVTNRTQPVQVSGLTGAVAVAAGAHHSLALRSDGTVWSWGRNNLGQLGDGTTTQRRTPVRVLTLTSIVGIGNGRDHGLAVRDDGTGWAWGLNDFGQLGDGTTQNRTSPVQISNLTDVEEVEGGRDFSAGLVAEDSEPDTTPPTQPGKPTGSSTTTSSITLAWSSSADESPITYRIYRDGAASHIDETTNTSFVDTGLTAGSTHTYTVDAIDSGGYIGPMSEPSDPITVLTGPSAIFADDFSSGSFANWTAVTRLTIDPASGGAAPPSARAQVTAQSAFAAKTLSGTYASICTGMRVNLGSNGGSVLVLLRLRTAANGNINRVFTDANGILYVKSDVSGTQKWSGVALGTGWHTLELCGTVGAAGTWDLYRDGVRIVAAWPANTGTTPVGRIEIGDTAAKTFTANFDDVLVDQTAG